MKNKILLIFAAFMAATSVNAASIKWSIGGALDPPAGKTIDTSAGSFVLAYIGTTSGIGVDAATFTAGLADSTYSIVDTGDWSDFYIARRGTYSNTKTYTASDSAGATYQAFFVKNGNYFLVNDPTISTIAISIDSATGAASTTAYLNGTSTGGAQLYAAGSGTSTITSVPEPSTAALALAGLALLLKRRKA